MTVFSSVEVAARRSSGFTIDSLIGKEKDDVKNESRSDNSRNCTDNSPKAVVRSSSAGIHRPTPIVSGSSVSRRACSPCSQVSAVNLSVSPARDLPRDHHLNSSPGHSNDRQLSPGHIPTNIGLNLGINLNYLDPASPLFLRRGLPVTAHSGSPLWTHHPHGLHRHIPSVSSTLLGRLNPLRPTGPHVTFPHPSAVAFHPALVGAPRDFYPPYPWNVTGHEGFPVPHIPGPGAGLFFHAFRKPKRHRTAFSPSQLLKLEQAFDRNQYVVGQERKKLAEDLNLSETQVKVWFQNRRTKFKRVKAEDDSDGTDDTTDTDKTQGDNKVSHHVTRWKMETNQIEVDSDEDDDEEHAHSSGIHHEYLDDVDASS